MNNNEKENDSFDHGLGNIPVIPETPDRVKEALELSDYIQQVKKSEGDIDRITFQNRVDDRMDAIANQSTGENQIEDRKQPTSQETYLSLEEEEPTEILSDSNVVAQSNVEEEANYGECLDETASEPELMLSSEEKDSANEGGKDKRPPNPKKNHSYAVKAKKYAEITCSVLWNVVRCVLTGLYRTTKFIVMMITVLVIAGVISCCVLFARYHSLYTSIRQTEYDRIANLSNETFSNLNNTRIYDDKDKLLAEITSADYEYVEINNVSRLIQEGYIAVEDKNFKEHIGVDPTALMRAGSALVKNSGEITQGGSTITQQVVKNTLLTSEQTYVRKCAEILLAIDMEKKFTKAQIMEFYVNSNFYGNQCYGVEAACQYYFGKNASEVNVSEAAMIVGMSNSPSRYNPVANYDLAIEKRDNVLVKMLKHGVINQQEFDEAKADKLLVVQKRTESVNETYQVSYAIYSAVVTLMERDGFEFKYSFKDRDEYYEYKERYSEAYSEMSEYVRGGGFDIYTSLNNKKQKQLQKSVDSVLTCFSEKQADGRYAVQGAAVCVDNETGYITAIVGGRGKDDQYNRAYLARRQPGSTIKPLLDYAPAFETGEYYPSKIMNDHAITNGPKNSGGSYRGNICMREAVARSINTIAYQTLQGIGVANGLAYLDSMRFNSLSYVDNDNLVISIGGFTNGVRVVDMAKGYSTLATGGNYIERNCIRMIKQQGEGLIFTDTKTSHQVYSEDTAWLMTSCLRGTMELPYGTGHGCALEGQVCAGKTGTTNDSKDGWFCGYTTRYTTSVWVGRDDNKSISGMYGATYAGKIWQGYMNAIHQGLSKENFVKPDTIKKKNVDSQGKPTKIMTGKQDYFSSAAEDKRSLLEKAQAKKKAEDRAEKAVAKYEKTEITKVQDCYEIDEQHADVLAIVSVLEDTDLRVELTTRVADKYDELKKEKSKWSKVMAAYEIEQARARQRAAEKAKQEAAKAAKTKAKNAAINRFHNALNAVKEVKDTVTDYTYSLLELASECLEECEGYDEYKSLLKEYNAEKQRIANLAAANQAAENAEQSAHNTQEQETEDTEQSDEDGLEEEGE